MEDDFHVSPFWNFHGIPRSAGLHTYWEDKALPLPEATMPERTHAGAVDHRWSQLSPGFWPSPPGRQQMPHCSMTKCPAEPFPDC